MSLGALEEIFPGNFHTCSTKNSYPFHSKLRPERGYCICLSGNGLWPASVISCYLSGPSCFEDNYLCSHLHTCHRSVRTCRSIRHVRSGISTSILFGYWSRSNNMRLVLQLDNALNATGVDVCAGARDICPPPAASAAHIRQSAASDCCARDILPPPVAGLPRPAGGQRPAVITLAHYLYYGTADRMLANVRAWRCRFASLSRRLDGALATHILHSGRLVVPGGPLLNTYKR